MKPDLINYLVCPICRSELRTKGEQENGEVQSGILECAETHRFPIREGIPRMLVSSEGVEQVKDSFSNKWRIFEDATFSQKEMDFQFKWYISRYGFKDEDELKRFLKAKSCVLDVGCGVGRAVGWFSDYVEGPVFGIDLSEAIGIAYKHYGKRKNAHLIQADIRDLPFKEETFDFISCDQVIHHTPRPEESFDKLTRRLKNGGEIAVYVYKKKGPIREFCDDYIRERTTKMSVDDCMKFADSVTKLGKALADLKAEITVTEDIPLLDIKAGTYDIQRFFYWNVLKCFWDDEDDFERSLAVNFDWYHPKHAYRFTPKEFRGWFERRGLKILYSKVIESGVSVRGMKV